jgi:hypothetical protein
MVAGEKKLFPTVTPALVPPMVGPVVVSDPPPPPQAARLAIASIRSTAVRCIVTSIMRFHILALRHIATRAIVHQ